MIDLGHEFSDPQLLDCALTHRSAASGNNERLEFLGDSLIDLVIGEALYQRFPQAREGWLTRARAELVCEAGLARIARRLQIGPRLRLGAGEIKNHGAERDSILADALEALTAAVYLDAGFDACRQRVLDWFGASLAALEEHGISKDAKTRLQEWLQGRGLELPQYVLMEARGKDHAKIFEVCCRLEEPELEVSAEGHSRREAEQRAASGILERLALVIAS